MESTSTILKARNARGSEQGQSNHPQFPMIKVTVIQPPRPAPPVAAQKDTFTKFVQEVKY